MNFGEVLSKAWQIIWKHKVLWIFGIFAGCGGQSANSFNYSGNSESFRGFEGFRDFGDVPIPPGLRKFGFGIERFFDSLSEVEIVLLVLGAILVGLLLALVALALRTVGRIALIQGTVEADSGTTHLLFSQLWNGTKPYFWRVLGLNVLVFIVFLAVMIVVGLFAAGFGVLTLGIGLVCLIPLLCLLIPAGWLLSIVIEQANLALVIEDLSIVDAFQRGWQIFKDNLGSMVVMGLLLNLGIPLVIGLIIAIPVIFIVSPAIIGIMTGGSEAIRTTLLISTICFLTYLPVLIVLDGGLKAYINSGWTLTYLRLVKPASPVILDVPETPLAPDAEEAE